MKRTITLLTTLLLAPLAAVTSFALGVTPLPDKVVGAVADRQDFQVPDCVQLTGWLGTRIAVNESNLLAKLDIDRLLEGYRKRPGRQSWEGEHVGKWLHAATLAWVNTGDPAPSAKLDETAAELCNCRLEDGYLATYSLDGKTWARWKEYDVWAHKISKWIKSVSGSQELLK